MVKDKFIAYFKEKTANALSMCNVTVHQLGVMVEEFVEELEWKTLSRSIPPILWNSTRDTKPEPGLNAEMSKLLLLCTQSGFMKGYYQFKDSTYRAEGTHVPVSAYYWVYLERPKTSKEAIKKMNETLEAVANDNKKFVRNHSTPLDHPVDFTELNVPKLKAKNIELSAIEIRDCYLPVEGTKSDTGQQMMKVARDVKEWVVSYFEAEGEGVLKAVMVKCYVQGSTKPLFRGIKLDKYEMWDNKGAWMLYFTLDIGGGSDE